MEEEQVVVVLDLSEFIDLALSVKKVSSCLSASQKSNVLGMLEILFPFDRC